MTAQLTLIRGLPGSGKSTLAKQLVQGLGLNRVHYEADQYFNDAAGNYKFDINFIMDAHDWCQDMTNRALNAGLHVIVSNTFTTIRELLPYYDIAAQYDIKPNVILCQGNFGSVHGVPPETYEKMKKRFQYSLSLDEEAIPLRPFVRRSTGSPLL